MKNGVKNLALMNFGLPEKRERNAPLRASIVKLMSLAGMPAVVVGHRFLIQARNSNQGPAGQASPSR